MKLEDELSSIEIFTSNIENPVIKQRVYQVLSKRMFYILSILVLILNASIPVINQIEKFPIVVTIVASISTVITGIITLINFKDVWYRYRVTAEKIKTECMLLNCRLGQYSCVNREKKFLIRIEEILAEDQESWIKSRFTDNEEDEEDK